MSLNLSREETLRRHRKMWNWIADETLKRQKTVTKEDYFNEMQIYDDNIPIDKCYCCDYVSRIAGSINCFNECPVYWNGGYFMYEPCC